MQNNLDLFIKLFSGRKEAYGLNNFCLKETLTPGIYKNHLDGIQRIGIYPLYDK